MIESIKFCYRLIYFTIIFLLICLPIMILGMIILLIYLPFSKSAQLPFLLRWWDCADFYVNRDPSTYLTVVAQGWWKRYTWLAFRNPMNYFDYQYLGLHCKDPIKYIRYVPEESIIGDLTKNGFRYIELQNGNNKIYFEYYWIKRLPYFNNHCIRFRLGYKIKDMEHPEGQIVQWCLVLSPWAGYKGS